SGQSRGCISEKLTGPPGLELHQLNKALVVMPLYQLALGIMKPRQIFLRKIDPAIVHILPDVTDDVRHLQSQPQLDCVLFTALVAIPKNLDAHQADRAGDSIAINPELFESGVSQRAQVHFYAGNDFLQHAGRQRVFGDQPSYVASKKRLVLSRSV